MKTTIKLDASRALVIAPAPDRPGVEIAFLMFGATMGGATLTPDQCQAVSVGLEIALDKSKKAA